jgi:hypothetical protein
MHPYSRYWFQKSLFDSQPIGNIAPLDEYTCDETEYANPNQIKQYHQNAGYECLQGSGKVTGWLFSLDKTNFLEQEKAGLLEPLYESGNILFFEDIVECVKPEDLAAFLRWLGKKEILQRLNGIVFGRFNQYPEQPRYKTAITQVIGGEFALPDIPVLYNLSFGHTSPICVIPYGAMAEIDCDNAAFSILESGCV